jgi:flagellar assembly factor FliW
VKVSTARFGEVEVTDDRVLVFPEGLPGFEGKQYVLLERPETPSIEWLQSLSDPNVSLMVLDPSRFDLGYEPKPKPAELSPIEGDAETAKIACRVVVRNGERPGQSYLNLFAPILINFSKRLAMQVPLVGSGHDVREEFPREAAT